MEWEEWLRTDTPQKNSSKKKGKVCQWGFLETWVKPGALPPGVKEGKRGKGYEMKSGLYFIFWRLIAHPPLPPTPFWTSVASFYSAVCGCSRQTWCFHKQKFCRRPLQLCLEEWSSWRISWRDALHSPFIMSVLETETVFNRQILKRKLCKLVQCCGIHM